MFVFGGLIVIVLLPPWFWNREWSCCGCFTCLGRKRTTIPATLQSSATAFVPPSFASASSTLSTSSSGVLAPGRTSPLTNPHWAVRVVIGMVVYIVLAENVATIDNPFQKNYLPGTAKAQI